MEAVNGPWCVWLQKVVCGCRGKNREMRTAPSPKARKFNIQLESTDTTSVRSTQKVAQYKTSWLMTQSMHYTILRLKEHHLCVFIQHLSSWSNNKIVAFQIMLLLNHSLKVQTLSKTTVSQIFLVSNPNVLRFPNSLYSYSVLHTHTHLSLNNTRCSGVCVSNKIKSEQCHVIE